MHAVVPVLLVLLMGLVGADEHLFVVQPLPFERLFVQERFDADAACFAAEMAAQSVGACEAATAAPVTAAGEFASADEFLFTGVETLVPFAVVLARKGLAADGADEGSLVGVGSKVASEVVGACEFLWA